MIAASFSVFAKNMRHKRQKRQKSPGVTPKLRQSEVRAIMRMLRPTLLRMYRRSR